MAKGKSLTKDGATLRTRDHDAIQQWAEEREAKPATVPGSEHGKQLGVLTLDFPGYRGDRLEHVSWEEWFETFDARDLEFLYQETLANGNQSNFFKVVRGGDEDK